MMLKGKLPNMLIVTLFTICVSACGGSGSENTTQIPPEPMPPAQISPIPPNTITPLFANSVASNDIDFIRDSETNSFSQLRYLGQELREMPDSRNVNLFDPNAYIFEALFTDGAVVNIWLHSSFADVSEAQTFAEKVTTPLGVLPVFMRNKLSHVVIHKGNAGAFAESIEGFFVLYSDNIDLRISNNDLEETVFHETIHATLDETYLTSSSWLNAQAADNAFVTTYALENSFKEDMAESALFAYTMLKYPDRLPENVEVWLQENIPNRLVFFQTVFE